MDFIYETEEIPLRDCPQAQGKRQKKPVRAPGLLDKFAMATADI
jgi:hypothetical protein